MCRVLTSLVSSQVQREWWESRGLTDGVISGRLRLVESGLESWDRRARLLLPLYAMLEDGSRAVPSLDTDTMDVLQLAFRTQADTKEFNISTGLVEIFLLSLNQYR